MPNDVVLTEAERYIVVARFKGYLSDFAGALETLNEGIERHPDDGPLYRHRGHRLITFKRFDEAIADFERAIELTKGKPDVFEYYRKEFMRDAELLFLGRLTEMNQQRLLVNAENIEKLRDVYKSTLYSSIWYHYGLAFYMKGDFDRCATEYLKALDWSVDDDMKAAASDWVYMAYRRSGRHDEARAFLDALPDDLHVTESSYYSRVRMYKGLLEPERLLEDATKDNTALVTQGYGLGNWFLYNGRTEDAINVFERITNLRVTNAFGHIAAEIDLARLKGGN